MISTTEAEATHQTLSGSGGDFCHITAPSILAVAVVLALVYWCAEPPVLDLTRTHKVTDCPVHHVPLVIARAPITYGKLNPWAWNYFRASEASFPHAGTMVFASNYDSSEWPWEYRFARVWQCPDCVRAEERWYAGDEHPR